MLVEISGGRTFDGLEIVRGGSLVRVLKNKTVSSFTCNKSLYSFSFDQIWTNKDYT